MAILPNLAFISLIWFFPFQNPFLPNVKVNQTNHDFTDWPSISISPSGIVYVSYDVWIGWIPPESTHIYLNISFDEGNTFDPDRIIVKGEKCAQNLSLLVDKNEKIHLLYKEYPNLSTYDRLFYTNSNDSGQSFLVKTQVDDNPTPVPIGFADIAINDSGNIYVVWNDARSINFYSHIYFARSTDGGISFPHIVQVDTGIVSKEGLLPSIILDDNGTIFITWTQRYLGNWNIYLCKSTDMGNSFYGFVRVDTFSINTYSSEVATIGSDSIFVCYNAWGDSINSIYVSRSIDGGNSFENTVGINDSVFSSCDKPKICSTQDGNVYVIWEMRFDPLAEINADIYYDFSNDGGLSFHEDIMVNDNTSDSTRELASVSKDSEGNIYVAWKDWRSGYDIYFARTNLSSIEEKKRTNMQPSKINYYPNPFRKEIYIRLDKNRNGRKFKDRILIIHDICGRVVIDFLLEYSSVNEKIIWDGKDKYGKEVNSGVYFLKIGNTNIGKITKLN